MAGTKTGDDAKALYNSVFKDWKMPEEGAGDGTVGKLVPRHEYGNTGIDMPVISIGGFMSLAVTVMHNRSLRKRMCLIQPLSILCKNKAMPWVMVNAILMPIVLIIVAWATPVAQLILSEELVPKWAACLICSVVAPAVWILFTQLVFGCSEHPYHNDRLLDYSLSLGVNHIETARHCECELRAASCELPSAALSYLTLAPLRHRHGERGPAPPDAEEAPGQEGGLDHPDEDPAVQGPDRQKRRQRRLGRPDEGRALPDRRRQGWLLRDARNGGHRREIVRNIPALLCSALLSSARMLIG